MKNFKNKTACIRSDMNRIKDVSTVAYSGGYPFSISGDIRSVPS